MTENDTVNYSQRHYLYLVSIGKWPSRHIPRTAATGRILEITDGGIVRVAWATGDTASHFTDNLAVVA